MARLVISEAFVLRCAIHFLYLSVCLCQRDCTTVDCPKLENCIEEVLEGGACCASCLQKGCTCEGYQYYDCINAGFKNGKVPEGNSYFVDYGSTECSCPAGEGRISCSFISCPDMPPNCIEVSDPVDGCMQCERVGCVHEKQKFDAGQFLYIDTCELCHCPEEGGKLVCHLELNCDPENNQKPILAAPPRVDNRDNSYPNKFGQPGHTYHSEPYGGLPPSKYRLLDKEEPKSYDGPMAFPETFPQSSVFPTPSSTANKITSASHGSERTSILPSFDGQNKLELRERYGVHDRPADRDEVTKSPLREEQSTSRPQTHKSTTPWLSSQAVRNVQSVTENVNLLNEPKSSDSVIFQLNQGLGSEKHPSYPHRILESADHQQTLSKPETLPHNGLDNMTSSLIHTQATSHGQSELQRTVSPDEGQMETEKEEEIVTLHRITGSEGGDVPSQRGSVHQERNHEELWSTDPNSSYEKATPEPITSPQSRPEYLTTPMVHFITTTSQPAVRFTKDERRPSKNPVELLLTRHRENQEEGPEKEKKRQYRPVVLLKPDREAGTIDSAEDLLKKCCAAGQKWATKNQCSHMPLLNMDEHSICSVAQKQCCLISVKKSQCDLGMISAHGGDTCNVDETKQCTDDSYQVCCSCCALGLRVRREGMGCGGHQHLGYPCSHVFLTCCEEEDNPSDNSFRRKQLPGESSVLQKDSNFTKDAFFISATDEATNAVEEQEDVNECQLYLGQRCQHTCIKTWGSYHCGCHRGYILQQDGYSCRAETPSNDNRVRVDSPVVLPTTITTSRTTTSSTRLNLCAENGPCSQQCTEVAGSVRCSCFPGFLLMTDGHACEDVDECINSTHSCQPNERCVNTVGSFLCQLQLTCPAGHQLRDNVCEDIDECVVQAHNCGAGFVCKNTVGSFLCIPKQKCISGFTPDSHSNCIDINECNSLSEPCSSGFTCINTVGSFTCQKKIITCSNGYQASPDGAKCVDIDECQIGTHRCGVGQICHNLPGSYRCDCQTGYQYDALRKVCTDVNECWQYPGRLCAQTCENTPGSFHCTCTAGFSLAFDGKNCEDMNECDKKPCSQECANIYGSYQCYCRQGYYLKEDGHSCEDIDECSQGMRNLCAFKCVNVVGSYKCSCPPHGYIISANGHTCMDVDECKTGTHNCSLGQTCYNLHGSFRCLSFDCPPNYKKVSDTRCERLSCPPNSLECQKSPVRITYYQLSFQTNSVTPAQIFRIGPSPAYSSDQIFISIIKGNEEGYFSTRKLNSFTGAVYLQRQAKKPKDFLIDVEMKLMRQGTITSFLGRIYVFITASVM